MGKTKDNNSKITPPTSIRLEQGLASQLNVVSKSLDRPKSWIIQEALKHYLEEYQDLEIALEKLRSPSTNYLDWDTVKDDLHD